MVEHVVNAGLSQGSDVVLVSKQTDRQCIICSQGNRPGINVSATQNKICIIMLCSG